MENQFLTAYQSNNMDDTTHNVSPQGGNRACLCWDKETYSIKCCDGSLHAQGIGSINRNS